MRHAIRRLTAAAALTLLPMAAVSVATPAVSFACAPGETGVTNGCAPFCLPGLALDTNTGLCLPPSPPPPPPPAPPR
jgi:hypothetical protein